MSAAVTIGDETHLELGILSKDGDDCCDVENPMEGDEAEGAEEDIQAAEAKEVEELQKVTSTKPKPKLQTQKTLKLAPAMAQILKETDGTFGKKRYFWTLIKMMLLPVVALSFPLLVLDTFLDDLFKSNHLALFWYYLDTGPMQRSLCLDTLRESYAWLPGILINLFFILVPPVLVSVVWGGAGEGTFGFADLWTIRAYFLIWMSAFTLTIGIMVLRKKNYNAVDFPSSAIRWRKPSNIITFLSTTYDAVTMMSLVTVVELNPPKGDGTALFVLPDITAIFPKELQTLGVELIDVDASYWIAVSLAVAWILFGLWVYVVFEVRKNQDQLMENKAFDKLLPILTDKLFFFIIVNLVRGLSDPSSKDSFYHDSPVYTQQGIQTLSLVLLVFYASTAMMYQETIIARTDSSFENRNSDIRFKPSYSMHEKLGKMVIAVVASFAEEAGASPVFRIVSLVVGFLFTFFLWALSVFNSPCCVKSINIWRGLIWSILSWTGLVSIIAVATWKPYESTIPMTLLATGAILSGIISLICVCVLVPRWKKKDGVFYMWGFFPSEEAQEVWYSRPTPTQIQHPRQRVQFIATSKWTSFSALVTTECQLHTFGTNDHGQLSLGDTSSRYLFEHARGLWDQQLLVRQVACGGSHMIVLVEEGRVLSCGLGTSGQLGHGDRSSKEELQKISFFNDIPCRFVACGEEHSLILSELGQVFTFGAGGQGRLGHGNELDLETPKELMEDPISDLVVIGGDCGTNFTAVVSADNQIFMWGANDRGQCGQGEATPMESHPLKVDVPEVRRVSCGDGHVGVITTAGKVFTWGLSEVGQLGTGKPPPCKCLTAILPASAPTGDALDMDTQRVDDMFDYDKETGKFNFDFNESGVAYDEYEKTTVRRQVQLDIPLDAAKNFVVRFVPEPVELWGISYAGHVEVKNVETGVSRDIMLPAQESYDPAGTPGDPHASERIGPSCARISTAILFSQMAVMQRGGTVEDATVIQDLMYPVIERYHGRLMLYSWMFRQIKDAFAGNEVTPYPEYILEKIEKGQFQVDTEGQAHTKAYLTSWEAGQPTPPQRFFQRAFSPTPTEVQWFADKGITACSVACGFAHTSISCTKGGVFMFGAGASYRLGLGDVQNRFLPEEVVDIQDKQIVRVAAGRVRSLVQCANGTLWSFGETDELIGLGMDMTPKDGVTELPKLVDGSMAMQGEVIDFDCGRDHMCVVTSDGNLHGIGSADKGQLGSKMEGDHVHLNALTLCKNLGDEIKVRSVACGNECTAILSEAGDAYTFGAGYKGELGHGKKAPRMIHEPTRIEWFVEADIKLKDIDLGRYHAAAISTDGKIYTWGNDGEAVNVFYRNTIPKCKGVLGHGDGSFDLYLPQRVAGVKDDPDFKSISCGFAHSAALSTDGKLFTWGWGNAWALGHGDKHNCSTPTIVRSPQLKKATLIQAACGYLHTVALDSDGRVYTWGMGGHAQLGHGDLVQHTRPKLVDALVDSKRNIVTIGAGTYQSVFVTDKGEAWICGSFFLGGLGVGSVHRAVMTPVVVGACLDRKTTRADVGNHFVVVY